MGEQAHFSLPKPAAYTDLLKLRWGGLRTIRAGLEARVSLKPGGSIGGAKVNVGASIGVAFFPDRECHFGDRITLPSIPAGPNTGRGEVDHESVRRLLEKADAAMYAAKRKALRYWIHEHVADETLRGTVGRLSEPPPAA